MTAAADSPFIGTALLASQPLRPLILNLSRLFYRLFYLERRVEAFDRPALQKHLAARRLGFRLNRGSTREATSACWIVVGAGGTVMGTVTIKL